MTLPSAPAPQASRLRRVLALLAGAIGLFLLLLSLLLPLESLELFRLIVGGVLAPASRVLPWLAALSAVLLLLGRRLGRWTGRGVRGAALGFGLLALVLGLRAGWRVASGPAVRTVHYRSGDIDVEGSFYRPDGPGPFAAAVIVHGSAPFRRGFYDQWADSLARRGVAVLVPDKRGVGGSGGEFERRNNAARSYLELLASDIVAGVRFLDSQPEVDPRRVGLVGISQGGWVGPLAAAEDPSIAYLVLLSGPATSTGEENTWSELRGDHDSPALVSFAVANDSLTRTPPTGYDPRATLGRLTMPSLWLFGEEDNSVPTAKSVAVLDSLAAEGHPVASRVFPGADHVMVRHDGRFGLMHTDASSWDVWLGWVARRVGLEKS